MPPDLPAENRSIRNPGLLPHQGLVGLQAVPFSSKLSLDLPNQKQNPARGSSGRHISYRQAQLQDNGGLWSSSPGLETTPGLVS
jgi:hypothetical protein